MPRAIPGKGEKVRNAATLTAALLLAGCSTVIIPSKLYDMKEGKVLSASFAWKGELSGPVKIDRDTESCVGEYKSIIGGSTTVGTGVSAVGWGMLFGSLYSTATVDRAQKGVAVAICPSGLTFECEYITNVGFTTVTGHGACKDNKANSYRLMF